MKKCFKCGNEKALGEFYHHNKMGDGHLNKCIDCTKLDTKARAERLSKNPDWVNSEKKRGRDKYHRLNYKGKNKPSKEKKRQINTEYFNRFPEKKAARYAISKMKTIIHGNHFHHWSYNDSDLRSVIELSVLDHNKIHRYMIYDQERKMYRSVFDNILLDSMQSHINLLEKIKLMP